MHWRHGWRLQDNWDNRLFTQSCLFVTPWTAAHQVSLSIITSWNLLKLRSFKSVMPSHHLILCCSLLLLPLISPSISLYQWVSTLGSQSTRASTSASILPMKIQGWFSWGLTGLISLQSKELSRVFSTTTLWKHQFKGSTLPISMGSTEHTNGIRFKHFFVLSLQEKCLPSSHVKWSKQGQMHSLKKKKGRIGGALAP